MKVLNLLAYVSKLYVIFQQRLNSFETTQTSDEQNDSRYLFFWVILHMHMYYTVNSFPLPFAIHAD